MQVVNTSNIFQRIVFARLSRSDPLRCSVLQCPVSQLCSWEARSKQTCVKNLRSNDFEEVCALLWESCLMRSTARVRRPSKVIASGVRKPGPPSPESWFNIHCLHSPKDPCDWIVLKACICREFPSSMVASEAKHRIKLYLQTQKWLICLSLAGLHPSSSTLY